MSPLQQVVNLIQQSKKILLLGHMNPDGDAVGSVLALALALRKLDKKTAAAVPDPITQVLHFLPALDLLDTSIAGVNDLVISFPLTGQHNVEVSSRVEDGKLKIFVHSEKGESFSAEDAIFAPGEADYDLIICCDTPDLPQLGKLFEINPDLFYEIPVINIDHHPSNTGYGRVNLVDVTSASASEIILRVIQALESESNKKLLDEDIATLILTGIITDTGSFQNANTTPRSFEISADLIEAGARQQEIINNIYKTKQLSTLKLWGRVLSKIEFDPLYKIVWSAITTEDLVKSGADDSEVGDIIDELMTNAPGAEIVLLLRQKGNLISGSLRTTTPAISATEIAEIFGGGGHFRAAGFKIPNKKVEEFTSEIIKKIRDFQSKRLNLIPKENQNNVSAKKVKNDKVDSDEFVRKKQKNRRKK